jgi:hypothetical protein
VKIMYKGEIFGSSQVVNQDIVVPKNDQAMISGIEIHIPALKLLLLGLDTIGQLKKGTIALGLEAVVQTKIYTPIKRIKYEKTYPITLKKQT